MKQKAALGDFSSPWSHQLRAGLQHAIFASENAVAHVGDGKERPLTFPDAGNGPSATWTVYSWVAWLG